MTYLRASLLKIETRSPMPDFNIRPTEGVTLEPWDDPPSDQRASRAWPIPDIPHRHWAITSTEVVVKATADGGVEGAPDGTLGGRLFSCDWVESPSFPGPALNQIVDLSSVIRFTPSQNGHYCLAVRRSGGGAILIHFDRQL